MTTATKIHSRRYVRVVGSFCIMLTCSSCSCRQAENGVVVRNGDAARVDLLSGYEEVCSDLQGIGKLCAVPDCVSGVQWSTCEMGNDWSLIAVLTLASQSCDVAQCLGEQMTAMQYCGIPCSMPSWIGDQVSELVSQDNEGCFSFKVAVFAPTRFEKTPLLHGFVLPISDTSLLLYLHTN